jgi:hypothetical protein
MESLNIIIGSVPVVELSPIYLNKLLVAAFIVAILVSMAVLGKTSDRREALK